VYMQDRHSFNPTDYAAKLQIAAADLRRGGSLCQDRARLVLRLERRAAAILRPDSRHDAEELLAYRAIA
jgi:hypothetical protein